MPYQILCNGVKREGVKVSPDLASGLLCYVPLHNIRDGIAFYAKIVGFFDQRILAVYNSEPDKYVLETDNFEGTLRRAYDEDELAIAEDHIDIRFGYRTLASGNLALAVYLPDLVEKSASHVKQWSGYHLENPEWTTESDPPFQMWKARYLEGSCDVVNGQ